jgi:hypothetical protein
MNNLLCTADLISLAYCLVKIPITGLCGFFSDKSIGKISRLASLPINFEFKISSFSLIRELANIIPENLCLNPLNYTNGREELQFFPFI